MPDPSNIYSLISSIVTLAVGAGGIKLFEKFYKARREDRENQKDGWQFAIETMQNQIQNERKLNKEMIDEERLKNKEYAIQTTQQINEIKTELADTKKELIYTKSKMQHMEVSMVKAGLIDEIDKINQVLDSRDNIINEIQLKVENLPSKKAKTFK